MRIGQGTELSQELWQVNQEATRQAATIGSTIDGPFDK